MEDSKVTYIIRQSGPNDVWQIQRLVYNCFGDRNDKILANIENGRYWVADKDGLVIAMTAINNSGVYNGYEVDWTCTDPKYRQNGIMHALFKRALMDVPHTEDVYCSCWAVGDETAQIHLWSLMRDFDFTEVVHGRARYAAKFYNDLCSDRCIMKRGESCTCREDLYIRKAREVVAYVNEMAIDLPV